MPGVVVPCTLLGLPSLHYTCYTAGMCLGWKRRWKLCQEASQVFCSLQPLHQHSPSKLQEGKNCHLYRERCSLTCSIPEHLSCLQKHASAQQSQELLGSREILPFPGHLW